MRYKIELSEEQLRIMRNAIEEYFRLRLGQFWDLSDDLAFIGFDYKHHSKEDFDSRIEARDEFRAWTGYWFRRRVIGTEMLSKLKTDDVNSAIDMWHVIEHQQFLDNPNREKMQYHRANGPLYQTGPEELMKIEGVKA